MKLPKDVKKRWLKALRSGDYRQGKYQVYEPHDKSFCCLGVLQSELMDGRCEIDPISEQFVGCPSPAFYAAHGIEIKVKVGAEEDDQVDRLMKMNDGLDDFMNVPPKSFKEIAAYISKNIKTL